MRHWWLILSIVTFLCRHMIIWTAPSFLKHSEKTTSDSIIGYTTIKRNTQNRQKTCLENLNMNSIYIYEQSKKSLTKGNKRWIGQRQAQRLYLEVWWDMTLRILFLFWHIKKCFGEEWPRNFCGLSKGRPMRMSWNKKGLTYGREIAAKSIFKGWAWTERREIWDQCMDFSGDTGTQLTLTDTQTTQARV